MAKIPRVEISDKALMILKIETALSGKSQKDTLEDLIMRGTSPDAIAFIKGRAEIGSIEFEINEDHTKTKINLIPKNQKGD